MLGRPRASWMVRLRSPCSHSHAGEPELPYDIVDRSVVQAEQGFGVWIRIQECGMLLSVLAGIVAMELMHGLSRQLVPSMLAFV